MSTEGHNPIAILRADIAKVIGDKSRDPQRISFTHTLDANGIDDVDLERLNDELQEMFLGVHRIKDIVVVRSVTAKDSLDVRVSRPLTPAVA